MTIKDGLPPIHPGEFLKEALEELGTSQAEFARAITAAGLIFIGPTAEAMQVMGSKTSARRAAINAGAPVVPGTTEALKDFDGQVLDVRTPREFAAGHVAGAINVPLSGSSVGTKAGFLLRSRTLTRAYRALRQLGVEQPERFNAWYFPSIAEYSAILERCGSPPPV